MNFHSVKTRNFADEKVLLISGHYAYDFDSFLHAKKYFRKALLSLITLPIHHKWYILTPEGSYLIIENIRHQLKTIQSDLPVYATIGDVCLFIRRTSTSFIVAIPTDINNPYLKCASLNLIKKKLSQTCSYAWKFI